ncbi:DUF3969 family protein [Xenorhabdus sp. XENO-10]|uniref:DUF3969 family protein n=1 Tax=Xenorhabdus yunnanensis TaxID=3025878 RepID=A0ABT5LFD6_9GAMM|nr:DUF3969 family protein [Xenorhabdus yunnanensis]MDC9589808.1 DUF3969 family protein [Xenorhabdus yunnanensis]
MILYYGLDERYAEKFFSLLILGIVHSLDKKLISIDEAEGYIFTPSVLGLLKEIKATKELNDIVEAGCLLEDIANLAPEGWQNHIDELIKKTSFVIKNSKDVGINVLNRREIKLVGVDRPPTDWS